MCHIQRRFPLTAFPIVQGENYKPDYIFKWSTVQMWSPVSARKEFFTTRRDRGRHDAYLTTNVKDLTHIAAEAL